MKLLSATLLGLGATVAAAPLSSIPVVSREVAGAKKRGIAFNTPRYLNFFNTPNRKTTWSYNWDSTVERGAEYLFEYVPMLHSNRPDHTGRWFANVDYYARLGPGATHVLSFNEPDQCG